MLVIDRITHYVCVQKLTEKFWWFYIDCIVWTTYESHRPPPAQLSDCVFFFFCLIDLNVKNIRYMPHEFRMLKQ